MKGKQVLMGVAAMTALAVAYLAGSHYLTVKSLSELTGLSIPFSSRVSTNDNGGMMGGTRDIWVQVSHFSDLVTQCSRDSAYEHGVIDYRKYRVNATQFSERGLGQKPGCVKATRSEHGAIIIAIDNGYIFISEQWQ